MMADTVVLPISSSNGGVQTNDRSERRCEKSARAVNTSAHRRYSASMYAYNTAADNSFGSIVPNQRRVSPRGVGA